jgi:PAS domain S-box-containing protein
VVSEAGWSAMFSTAFKQSRNPMVLLDDSRQLVDANGAFVKLLGHRRDELLGQPAWHFVVGGPTVSPKQWHEALAAGEFTGQTELRCADGSTVAVQWGAHPEVVTGQFLVLMVALSTSRWGGRFRRPASGDAQVGSLSEREREIVRLVALGSTGPEIAAELQIAHDTVRTHVRNAMTKTGARSRAHLVAVALGNGYALG